MTVIKTTFGEGGSGSTPKGSGAPTLAQTLRDVADDLENVKNPGSGALRTGGVVASPLLSDPTTGSSQLTGEGNTTWNVKVAAHECEVQGLAKVFALQDDFSIHSGSYLAGFVNGASCIAAIVNKNVAGTITTVAVKGTPATTGTEVAPTNAEIQAAVGAANGWVKVGECTLERDGDTSVVESQDNTKMEAHLGRSETLLTTKG